MTNLIQNPSSVIPDLAAFVDAVPVAQRFTVPYVGNLPSEQRMAVLKALANDAGLRLPDTRLPEGTALLPIGEESRRAMKADLAKLPELQPGLYAYRARLLAENTVDSRIPTTGVRMNALTGGLHGKDKDAKNAIGYTADGFTQVAQFIKPLSIRNGFAENMTALPPALRAQVFNHWAMSTPRDENVVMRTFAGGNGRLIRAVTSEKHSLETGDDRSVVDSLLSLPPGAKLRATREPGGRYSEMEVIWPMLDRELRVGDLAYGGIRITNSETKGSALRVEAFVLRVLCYNFTTAFSEDFEADELSLKHVGDLTRRLPAMIRRAQERIEPLVLAFGDAYKEALPANFTSRGEALERVGKVFMLPVTTLERAAALWDADGMKSAGDTRAGLVHALTRASQEEGVTSAGNTERAAGRIIMDGWGALA
jgi:hypothetical protein